MSGSELDKRSAASYENLLVWQRGIGLAKEVYRLTAKLPAEERFGLTDQARRAAVSVPANIAEGVGRDHTKEFLRFLSIAKGSLAELKTYLILIDQMGFVKHEELRHASQETIEIGRMISGLQASLRKRLSENRPGKKSAS